MDYEGHCTTHALLRLVERVTHWFENNKATLALFLNVEGVFDKVGITGLIIAGIPAHIIQLLHSYLNNRSSTVVHGNSESSRRSVLAGVPQGSLLGPSFFNTDMNDISGLQKDSNVAISRCADDRNVTMRSGSMGLATSKLNSANKILEPWL